MSYQLIQISPLQRVRNSVGGFPPKRSHAGTKAPEGHKYVPIEDKPDYDSATQTIQRKLTADSDGWEIVAKPPPDPRDTARGQMRANWDALPDWITGPFGDKFNAANLFLDAGQDGRAANLIQYADPPSGYDATQLATFNAVKQQFADAISALPAAT